MPRPVRKIFQALLAVLCCAAPLTAQPGQEPDAAMTRPEEPAPDRVERARAILAEVPAVDGHNDLPWQFRERVGNRMERMDIAATDAALEPPLHTDVPRLRAGGLGAQFWSVYVPARCRAGGGRRRCWSRSTWSHRMAERYPDDLRDGLPPPTTSADLRGRQGSRR